MKVFIYILSFALITCAIPNNDTKVTKNKPCLTENIQLFDSFHKDSFPPLKPAFISTLQDSRLILAGEVHTIWKSEDIRYAFLEYLHKNVGTNHIFIEESTSKGYLLNQYIHTGEEKYLDIVFDKQQKDTIKRKRNENQKEKIISLYNYNQTLIPEKRISIIGLDVERQGFDWSIYVIKELLSKVNFGKEERKYAELYIQGLENKSKTSRVDLKRWYNTFMLATENKTPNNYEEIIYASILHGLEFMENKKSFSKRDLFMYQRIKDWYNIHSENDKYYFQVGLNHIKTTKGKLAYLLLNEKSPLQQHMTLIPFNYFGYTHNYYGTPYKKGELSIKELDDKTADELLQNHPLGIIHWNKCHTYPYPIFQLLIQQ